MGVPLHKFGLTLKIMKQIVWYLQLLDSTTTPDGMMSLCDGCRREAGVDDTWRVVCLLNLQWKLSSSPVPVVVDEKHAASELADEKNIGCSLSRHRSQRWPDCTTLLRWLGE